MNLIQEEGKSQAEAIKEEGKAKATAAYTQAAVAGVKTVVSIGQAGATVHADFKATKAAGEIKAVKGAHADEDEKIAGEVAEKNAAMAAPTKKQMQLKQAKLDELRNMEAGEIKVSKDIKEEATEAQNATSKIGQHRAESAQKEQELESVQIKKDKTEAKAEQKTEEKHTKYAEYDKKIRNEQEYKDMAETYKGQGGIAKLEKELKDDQKELHKLDREVYKYKQKAVTSKSAAEEYDASTMQNIQSLRQGDKLYTHMQMWGGVSTVQVKRLNILLKVKWPSRKLIGGQRKRALPLTNKLLLKATTPSAQAIKMLKLPSMQWLKP